jgi:hypothetical protein
LAEIKMCLEQEALVGWFVATRREDAHFDASAIQRVRRLGSGTDEDAAA